jgi:NAD(P)H dehydrogenase (quinone)
LCCKTENMKKILVINGHPYAKSYVSALFKAYAANLNPSACEVRTLDLGALHFDPVLRYGYAERMEEDQVILQSQEAVKWADHLVFFYPVWWGSMPSLLHGWIERVLTPGFAYNMKGFSSEKHLKGRTAELFLTADGPAWYERLIPNSPIRLMRKHILDLCGIKLLNSHILGMTTFPKRGEAREKYLAKVIRQAQKFR